MIGYLLYELFAEHPLCLPERSADLDAEALALIARRDDDLISYDDWPTLQ